MDMDAIKSALADGGCSFTVEGHDNAILKAHEMSMSRDPAIACAGRTLKVMLNAWEVVMSEEVSRGTSPKMIMDAVMSATATNLTSTVHLLAKPEARLPAMLETATAVAQSCVSAMADAVINEFGAAGQPAGARSN